MATSVRLCVSYDLFMGLCIAFKMNIIPASKCIVDSDIVNDVMWMHQSVITHVVIRFLARLDKVQEELLYYPGRRVGVGVGVGGVGVSKMLKFLR